MVKYCGQYFFPRAQDHLCQRDRSHCSFRGDRCAQSGGGVLCRHKAEYQSCYLKPGFAYGGSCLPKDLRAILRYATLQSIQTPVLRATLESNKSQIETFVVRVLALKPSCVGMIGLAFKADTDDMRESPYVVVAKRLNRRRHQGTGPNPTQNVDRLMGSNKQAVETASAICRIFLLKDRRA